MGKLVVTEFITLDGIIEDPGGAEGTEHRRDCRNREPALALHGCAFSNQDFHSGCWSGHSIAHPNS